MLTRSSPLREWALFVLVALLPALGMGVLGLVALGNEDAAVRQGLRAELELAAAELRTAIERELSRLDSASAEELASLSRPFADRVELDAHGALTSPPSAAPPAAQPDPSCQRQLGRLGDREAHQHVLAHCQEATTPSGRFVWPLAALDPRTQPPVPAATIEAWLAAHALRMAPAERAVTRRELERAAWLSAGERLRLAGHLDPAPIVQRAAASFVAPRRAAAAAGVPDIRWTEAGSRGRLVQRDDGSYVGWVIHGGSLARAVRAGWPEHPAAMRARLRLGSERPAAPAIEVLPAGAFLVVEWADPGAAQRRGQRSRRVLMGTAAGLGIAAVALAALMFARMRSARRLSALRTDFVAAVSHELRTPIASLRMLSELLAEGRIDDPDERAEAQRALAREAKRLGDTVHRLLGFSRMEAGRDTLEPTEQRLAPIVSAAIDVFEERHPDAPQVERDLDDGVAAAVDADALGMAIGNLLENAYKYAREGGPYQVALEARSGAVRISVRDRGPGIARRHHRRIFRPFERADDRLSQATEGSGIGLSLVAHVARRHGGRAYVESAPGEGARFIIEIPREGT